MNEKLVLSRARAAEELERISSAQQRNRMRRETAHQRCSQQPFDAGRRTGGPGTGGGAEPLQPHPGLGAPSAQRRAAAGREHGHLDNFKVKSGRTVYD